MLDLTRSLLPELRARRLPGPAGAFAPAYDGLSIANLPAAVCAWLGAPPLPRAAPALDERIRAALPGPFRRVIVGVIDGLGLDLLQSALDSPDPDLQGWRDLAREGLLAPLTSIVPSTTAAALVTLWTGATPAAHGVLGYEMFLKEYSLTANMILHAPAAYQGDVGSLARAGFDPRAFLPVPTLGPHLTGQGVSVYAYQHASIMQSGLSTMLFPSAVLRPALTFGDICYQVAARIQAEPAERAYHYFYWSALDDLMHRYAPQDVRVRREMAGLALHLGVFLRSLPRDGQTLLLITADHGHIATPPHADFDLSQHPELTACLTLLPSGENRLPLVFLRSGREGDFLRYLETHWDGTFQSVSAREWIDSGWMGEPAHRHPRLEDRAGDRVVIPPPGAYWRWFERPVLLLGRHGGLTETEMVPALLGAVV